MSAIGFIPARGGSKRVPRKNLLPLGGRPLIAYTIEAARKAGIFERVVVSSDDEEILELAKREGAETDRRPAALGGDRVRFVEVLEEFLRRAGGGAEHVAVLLPTCPFRTAQDILAAHGMLLAAASSSFVVSVREYEFPPEFALELDGARARVLRPEVYAASTQSQSVGKSYHPNGAIYFAPVKLFMRERSFFREPLLGYLMPPERSLDIDNFYQFEIAEAMMRARK
ncbi:MAG: acylneuraminate cytidylyltransferase family protein [Chthoniobacteraceae bacterium]|jgi:CMP-N-acetylneuraminic acid synthetase